MRPAILLVSVGLTGFSLALLNGCSHAPAPPAQTPPPAQVSYPVERSVTDFAEFTGRVAPVHSVEVRSRVDGYLDSVHFKVGELVKQGDVLFVIDQRPFIAVLNRAKAQLQVAEAEQKQALTQIDEASATKNRADASLAYARQHLERSRKLLPTGAVTRDEFELHQSQLRQAEAEVMRAAAAIAAAQAAAVSAQAAEEAARAAVAVAQLDLDYTKVLAPVSGRVSRNNVSVGNLIQAGQMAGGTLLTTIVSVDPVYAYFAVDEHTVQRVQRLIREGRAGSAREQEVPVWLGLASEEGFPHRGTINFIDNQVRPNTGTMWVRGVFSNSDEALVAGYFARIRVPLGNSHDALLVTDRAIDSDQGNRVLYLLDKDNQVFSRPVHLGALHDGLREITDGLKPKERILVNGLLMLRPGMTVDPSVVDMPSSKVQKASDTAPMTSVATAASQPLSNAARGAGE